MTDNRNEAAAFEGLVGLREPFRWRQPRLYDAYVKACRFARFWTLIVGMLQVAVTVGEIGVANFRQLSSFPDTSPRDAFSLPFLAILVVTTAAVIIIALCGCGVWAFDRPRSWWPPAWASIVFLAWILTPHLYLNYVAMRVAAPFCVVMIAANLLVSGSEERTKLYDNASAAGRIRDR